MQELCNLSIGMFNLPLEEEEGEKWSCVGAGEICFLRNDKFSFATFTQKIS